MMVPSGRLDESSEENNVSVVYVEEEWAICYETRTVVYTQTRVDYPWKKRNWMRGGNFLKGGKGWSPSPVDWEIDWEEGEKPTLRQGKSSKEQDGVILAGNNEEKWSVSFKLFFIETDRCYSFECNCVGHR